MQLRAGGEEDVQGAGTQDCDVAALLKFRRVETAVRRAKRRFPTCKGLDQDNGGRGHGYAAGKWTKSSDFGPVDTMISRLAPLIPPLPSLGTSSPQISKNLPIYLLPTISASHTRTGAGLHMLRTGKMCGK